MANLPIQDNPNLNLNMEAMTTQTPGHADEFNMRYEQLLNNEKFLNAKQGDLAALAQVLKDAEADGDLVEVANWIVAQMAEYASQDENKGASKIGVHDADGNFTGTDVEAVLSELFTNVSNGKDLVGTAITDVDSNVSVPAKPTFADLDTAIRSISVGFDFVIPLGAETYYITDVDEDNKRLYMQKTYGSETVNERGFIYDNKGNLLRTITNCIGISRIGYVKRTLTGYGHEHYDLNDTLIRTVNLATSSHRNKDRGIFAADFWGYCFDYNGAQQGWFYNYGGTKLLSIGFGDTITASDAVLYTPKTAPIGYQTISSIIGISNPTVTGFNQLSKSEKLFFINY